MAGDPDQPRASDAQRAAAYESARANADAAYEAVGDAEDALVEAESARDARPASADDAERALDTWRVEFAEAAWHERRHDAHTAAQARDAARPTDASEDTPAAP